MSMVPTQWSSCRRMCVNNAGGGGRIKHVYKEKFFVFLDNTLRLES